MYGAIDYLQGAAKNDYRVDWNDVDLRYSLEVYDKADDYAGKSPIKDRQVIIVDEYQPVKFELRLIPNRDYHFVVFADFVPQDASDDANINVQRELGLRHKIGNNLGEITIKGDAINDEAGDAYFATKDITITNSASQDITLKRPYGKLRVIATDLAELNLNVEPKFVEVSYTAAHPVAFNAVTGEIEDEQTTTNYKYEYAKISKESLANHVYTEGYDDKSKFGVKNANNVERHTHMTLFTDYILAEKEGQTPYHFTMTVYGKNGSSDEIKTTEFNTDIPVERNKLTTVLGNVLTTATDINVTINDNFDDEIVIGGVTSAKELQEALDNVKPGMVNEINIIDHIAGNVQIVEIPETTIIINGQGCYKYDGTMQIVGKSEYKNATTIFKNINFETKDETALVGASFIYCNEQNGNTRYPDNVTVVGCTFNGTAKTVGASFRSLNGNLIFDGCKMTAGHSLMQLKSCGEANVIVKSTTINADRGIALGSTGNAAISKTNITAKSYGVRADGCTANTTIEASIIEANLPVVVRNLTAGEYTLNFTETTLTAGTEGANAEGYQVVFTKGDDEAEFVEPTGAFVANGAENYKVFPEPAVDENTFVADSLDDLMKWAYKAANTSESPNLVLTADIQLPNKAIVADDVNKTYTFTGEDIVVVDGKPSGNNWPVISDYETSKNAETGVYEYYGGVIDGGGHTIKGLRINHDLVASGFICWAKGAKVDNLTFDDAVVYNKGGNYDVNKETYTGIVIGRCWDGSHVNDCHIKNSSVLGKTEVGGIVGRVYRRTIKTNTPDGQPQNLMERMAYVTYCTTDNNSVVKGEKMIGGIVGMNYGAIVGQCVNNADVFATTDVAGGVAGYTRSYAAKSDGYIIGCKSSADATITSNAYAGGIVGQVFQDTKHYYTRSWVVGCASESQIVAAKPATMIGYSSNATITACWAVKNGANVIANDAKYTSTINEASFQYNAATEATQANIDAMNAAIEAFNASPDNISIDGTVGAKMLKRWALDINGVPVLQ